MWTWLDIPLRDRRPDEWQGLNLVQLEEHSASTRCASHRSTSHPRRSFLFFFNTELPFMVAARAILGNPQGFPIALSSFLP